MCGLCDNLGVIDDPEKPNCLKKCPECDSEPPWYLRMNMAAMLAGPNGWDEDDDMTEVQERRQKVVREEEADYLRRHLAGLIPHDFPNKKA